MPILMIYAIILFTLALLFYSISVWAGFFAKRLKTWHVYVFLLGLVTDFVATWLTYVSIGSIVFTLHSVLGFISIILMTLHVIWAIVVLIQKNEISLSNFHKISVFVWSIWLLSYISGFVLGAIKVV